MKILLFDVLLSSTRRKNTFFITFLIKSGGKYEIEMAISTKNIIIISIIITTFPKTPLFSFTK